MKYFFKFIILYLYKYYSININIYDININIINIYINIIL